MSDEMAIITDGLRKSYGRVQALRGVNLRVHRGEIFGFLGPNGAGKTTTIRCMLDLIRPQAGLIRILGIDPQQDPVAVRSQVGYLPGELNLEGNMNTDEVLHYFADLRGNRIDWGFVRELAQRLQVDLKMPFKNLSKGNKQKVGVMQALMPRPPLLLLDEPTSGLDPLMQQEVYRLLKEAQAAGSTIFFSSHIISEVEALAERVAIIREGVIVEEVRPSQLASMTMRRVHVRFREPVDWASLTQLEGVSALSKGDATHVTLQVEGEMDRLIKALAGLPVSTLETEHPSLEDIFLTYYRSEKAKAH